MNSRSVPAELHVVWSPELDRLPIIVIITTTTIIIIIINVPFRVTVAVLHVTVYNIEFCHMKVLLTCERQVGLYNFCLFLFLFACGRGRDKTLSRRKRGCELHHE